MSNTLNIRAVLEKPYFASGDDIPGLDFNREIVQPGEHADFPDGALGIRVDCDFWSVAALPLSFLNVPLSEIVADLWPAFIKEASFKADHGTIEQRIEFALDRAKAEEQKVDFLSKRLAEAEAELKRLRAARPDLHERSQRRYRRECNYFSAQYEHLLIAMAHAVDPKPEAPGLCKKCGLLASHYVHEDRYLKRHAAGYTADFRFPMRAEPEDGP